MADYIYEPLATYKNELKDKQNDNASRFFDDLVKKSQVDVEENREVVKIIKQKTAKKEIFQKLLNKANNKRGFLIFLIVVLFIVSLVLFILGFSQQVEVAENIPQFVLIIIGAVSLVLAVLLIVYIVRTLNKNIKEHKDVVSDLEKKISEQKQIAWNQMVRLNDLYDWGMAAEIATKTAPVIQLDPYFNVKRFEYMRDKYGLPEDLGPDSSIEYVQSGEIFGNPILIVNDLNTEIRPTIYTGTKFITWTTTSTDSKGNTVTHTHSQTLTATVTKPAPKYWRENTLYYCNDAAPDLSFSRKQSKANSMNQKEINSYVKKKGTKLQERARKSLTSGKTLTLLNDLKFETLFNALDRDHEQQFRLLFTPLAREEMLEIIEDKSIGYGDDFAFRKSKQINIIYSDHLAKTNLTCDPAIFFDYDIDNARLNFIKYQNNWFKSFYFAMAPLLAIPEYQQHKPTEYIYKSFYNDRVCDWEHEALVNSFSKDKLVHPDSKTENILKTVVTASKDDLEMLEVTSHGYDTIPHTDHIPMRGGDGYTHLVPVHWLEYIKVEMKSNVAVQVDQELSRSKFLDLARNDKEFASIIDNNVADDGEYLFKRNMFSFISDSKLNLNLNKQLKDIWNKNSNVNKQE